jgi:ketosteroid isomerase-like protein
MRRVLFRLFASAVLLAAGGGASSLRANPAPQSDANFAPLESWRAAVLAGDAAGLEALYSANPPATVATPQGKSTDVRAEVRVWTAQKTNGLSAVEISEVNRQSPQSDIVQTIFQTALTTRANSGRRKLYVSVGMLWQRQGDTWRILACQRNDFTRLAQPLSTRKDLYPANADANADIRAALGRAATSHKRVLLVFGGNWCYDCHVLETAFHSAAIAPLLKPFELVHVDVGEYNKNLDIAQRYEVPVAKGVPALAVLASDGRLLFAQKQHEFSATRRMGPEDIATFLQRWKS